MTENPVDTTFLDTNILVYAYDRTAGQKNIVAASILESLWNDKSGRISVQVMQEFYVTITRKVSLKMDATTARQIVLDLSNWQIHCPTSIDILEAIDIQIENQLSFWDSMLIQSAVRLGCTRIFSEDLTHGQTIAGVTVINPFIESKV